MARPIRTGLENEVPVQVVPDKKQIDPLDELQFRKPVRRHVAEFGVVFALIGSLIGAYIFRKHGPDSSALYWFIGSFVFLALGYLAPRVLHPVWKLWMKFAHVLSVIVTTAILTIMWTLVLIPIAFLLKIIGKRVMDLSYDPSTVTYWEEREDKYHNFKLLERQF